MAILIPYDVHSTSCSSHASFERSGSTWTKFQTQCNLWKRKKTPDSYKLSDASRLNSLFCLCLISKKSLAQLDCCCRPTRVEIDGIVASGCVWLSWFHMMSISTSCSSHVSFDRSNSSDLSVWSSFAPLICICTTAPNGLPALAFADSKRSHCKWIQNAHRTLRKKPIKRVSGKLGHRERRNRVKGGTTPRGCLWRSCGCTIWFCQS